MACAAPPKLAQSAAVPQTTPVVTACATTSVPSCPRMTGIVVPLTYAPPTRICSSPTRTKYPAEKPVADATTMEVSEAATAADTVVWTKLIDFAPDTVCYVHEAQRPDWTNVSSTHRVGPSTEAGASGRRKSLVAMSMHMRQRDFVARWRVDQRQQQIVRLLARCACWRSP